MWRWFAPKCPVKLRDKVWVEQRTRWLIREFGRRPLLEFSTILPTPEFFPDPFSGVEDDVPPMLRRVCQYMECDADRFRLTFFDADKPSYDEEGNPLWGATGFYVQQDGVKRPMIRVSTTILQDPLALVATLAHEVAHDRLLGEQRVSVEEPDHEPLTDLTTVFFGLGIFPAVTAFRTAAWNYGNMQYWQWSKQGYLTDNVFGYALALRSWLRSERGMPWSSHLSTNPRHAYRTGLRYLQKTGDCLTSHAEMLNGVLSREVHPDELTNGSDGLRLAAIQRLSELKTPTLEHIRAMERCLSHSDPEIQWEAISWLHSQSTLSECAVVRLLDIVRDGTEHQPIRAALLLVAKRDSIDNTPLAGRLLDELIELAARTDPEQRSVLAEPLATYGPKAALALKPFLNDLQRHLIQDSDQNSRFLIEQLLRIDPNLEARIRGLWSDTIVNRYQVAAKQARKSLNQKSRA